MLENNQVANNNAVVVANAVDLAIRIVNKLNSTIAQSAVSETGGYYNTQKLNTNDYIAQRMFNNIIKKGADV